MKNNAMLMPAVWGGFFIGVLSALPIVGAANLCCCLWVICGGMVAAYLLSRCTERRSPVTARWSACSRA